MTYPGPDKVTCRNFLTGVNYEITTGGSDNERITIREAKLAPRIRELQAERDNAHFRIRKLEEEIHQMNMTFARANDRIRDMDAEIRVLRAASMLGAFQEPKEKGPAHTD